MNKGLFLWFAQYLLWFTLGANKGRQYFAGDMHPVVGAGPKSFTKHTEAAAEVVIQTKLHFSK